MVEQATLVPGRQTVQGAVIGLPHIFVVPCACAAPRPQSAMIAAKPPTVAAKHHRPTPVKTHDQIDAPANTLDSMLPPSTFMPR